MAEYVTIDSETTIKGTNPKLNRASAFIPDNEIVYYGEAIDSDEVITFKHPEFTGESLVRPTAPLIVGQNIKFDLHHIRKTAKCGAIQQPLWDTQLAEYILTGQQSTWASLDELAEKYGGTVKDSKISDYFKKGIGADAIPEEEIKPYLEQDVLNTRLVFEKQYEIAAQEGMLPLIETQMRALSATTEMSYNGMAIDIKKLQEGKALLAKVKEDITKDLTTYLHKVLPKEIADTFNYASNKQLGSLLFGGDLTATVKVPDGVYKSGAKKGLVKYKNEEIRHIVIQSPARKKMAKATEKGALKVDADVLKNLLSYAVSSDEYTFIGNLLTIADVDKQLSTYYEGVENSIYPDGFVHQELNHCVTRTGRLSSSSPNMQNITNGPIKEVFVSRWGDEGQLIEIDYGQLEVVGLAIVSGDKQLIQDITDDVDIHTALYEDMYKRKPTKEQRKAFKPLTFGLIYGAGKTTLAANAGCTLAEAELFIKTFYKRYPDVEKFHATYAAEVKKNRKPHNQFGFKDATGKPVGASIMVDKLTGRRYVYREYDAPDWIKKRGTDYSFSPTEMKNYPCQGFATGDIVPLMLGVVFDELMKSGLKEHCLMINTVHDSMMFDCRKERVDEAIPFLKSIIECTPAYFKRAFGYKLPFDKFKCGVSVGDNWLDMKEL